MGKKILTSLFAILLAITVITPNYFGLVKAEGGTDDNGTSAVSEIVEVDKESEDDEQIIEDKEEEQGVLEVPAKSPAESPAESHIENDPVIEKPVKEIIEETEEDPIVEIDESEEVIIPEAVEEPVTEDKEELVPDTKKEAPASDAKSGSSIFGVNNLAETYADDSAVDTLTEYVHFDEQFELAGAEIVGLKSSYVKTQVGNSSRVALYGYSSGFDKEEPSTRWTIPENLGSKKVNPGLYTIFGGYFGVRWEGNIIKYPVDYWVTVEKKNLNIVPFANLSVNVTGCDDGSVTLYGTDSNPVGNGYSARVYENDSLTVGCNKVKGYACTLSVNGEEVNNGYGYSVENNGWTDLVITASYEPSLEDFAVVSLGTVTGNGTVSVTYKNETKELHSDSSLVLEDGTELIASAVPANGYVLESLTITDENRNEVVNGTALAKNHQYFVNATFTKIEITAEDVVLSVIYEKAGKSVIENKIDEIAAAKVNGKSVSESDYVLEKVEFESNSTVDYYCGVDSVYTILNLPVAGSHYFGSNGILSRRWVVGNKEKVRLTYRYEGNENNYPATLTANITVEIGEDTREQLTITQNQNPIRVTYSETDPDYITNAVITHLILKDKDGVSVYPYPKNPAEFTPDHFEVSPVKLDASSEVQEVTVTYNANYSDTYASSTGTVKVLVSKAPVRVDAKNETFVYNGTPAKLEVTLEPDTESLRSSLVQIVVGVEGDGAGFISVILPEPSLSDVVTNPQYTAIYTAVKALVGNGIEFGNTQSAIKSLKEILDRLGIDLGTASDIIDLIANIPDLGLKGSIHFGDHPVNAGVYTHVALTTNPNYRTAVDFATVTILKANAQIVWNETVSNEMTWTEAQEVKYGAHLEDESGKTVGKAFSKFTGVSTSGEYELISNTEPRDPGFYMEAASAELSEKNYTALNPVVLRRSFRIAKETVEITTNLKDGVEEAVSEYTGKPVRVEQFYDIDVVEESEKVSKSASYYAEHLSKDDLTVEYFDEDGNVLDEVPSAPGTYTVKISYAGDTNHKAAETKTVTYTINKADLTVTVPDRTFTYGEYSKEELEDYLAKVPVTVELNGKCEGLEAVVSLELVSNDSKWPHVGTYTIKANVTVEGMPEIATMIITNGELTITPRPITVRIDSHVKYAYDPDPEFTFTVVQNRAMKINKDRLCNDDTLASLNIAFDRKDLSEVPGIYNISGKTPFEPNPDYTITFIGGSLTIVRALTYVTDAKPVETVYNGEPVVYDNYRVVDANRNHEDDATVRVEYQKVGTAGRTTTAPTEAGEYIVYVTVYPDNKHVTFFDLPQTVISKLTINKAEAVIYVGSDEVEYGTPYDESDLGYTFECDLPEEDVAESITPYVVTTSESETLSLASVLLLEPGLYQTDATITGANPNVAITVVRGTLLVKKKDNPHHNEGEGEGGNGGNGGSGNNGNAAAHKVPNTSVE